MLKGAGIGVIGLVSVTLPGAAFGQNAGEAGVTFDLSLGQTFEATDNASLQDPADGEFRSITSISGDLASTTRSQQLTLGFTLGVELGDDDFELGTTGVDASFTRFGQTSEFGIEGNYFRRRIESATFTILDELGDELDITVTEGTRVDYAYGVRYEFGQNAPFTGQLRARQAFREFETDSTAAFDSRSTNLDADFGLELDPATQLTFGTAYSNRDEDDDEDTYREQYDFGLGLGRDLSETDRIAFRGTYRTGDVTSGIGAARSTSDFEGFGGSLSFNRSLRNGEFRVSASRQVNEGGTVDDLRLGRSIDFPAARLDLDGGVILSDGEVLPAIRVGYTRDAPAGQIRLSLNQRSGLNSDDETVLNTIGSASYNQTINALSSVGLSVSLASQSVVGGDDTTNRLNAGASYNRTIARDFGLTAGYRYALISETGTDDRSSNTVFVTLSRNFSIRQ